ncbi:ABC transporter ATP-binding protein/permease [Kitasatospora purpeofusca]|uniref:ABC transporter ATP-binding protein n=1 Tax=Kitasatospora purpeofusca TaxID=67352 RepID=UPI003251BBB3
MKKQPARPTAIRPRILRLFAPHRARLAVIALLVLVSAAVATVPPLLIRLILDDALPHGRTGLLTLLALVMIALTAASTALGVFQAHQSMIVGQRIMSGLRTEVYAHLQRMSLGFFTRTHTGEVQSRISNDIGGMDTVVTTAVTTVLGSGATVLAALTAMTLLDWRLALVSLALLPLFVWVNNRVGRERREIVRERYEKVAALTTLIEESLSVSGFLLGRLLGRSRAVTEEFARQSTALGEISVRTTMAGRWRQAGLQVVVAAMPVVIYWAAGLRGSPVTVGTLVAFAALQQSLLGPAVQLTQVGAVVQSSLSLFERVFEYLDLPVDVPEPSSPTPLTAARGHVRFERVHFGYGDEPVLRDISLDVRPGTRLAVVGPTGAGKTSLGYLLLRLHDVTAGRITIDGVDVRDLDFETLARTVGAVSQDSHLLHATVAENLRLGKPGATDEELVEAARMAHIHDLVASLPDGYATVVGERGYRFSGGEKQRLAIARTILRDPPILLLDEATSALDTRTERAVQEALAQLSRNRTTITIAHRLSTVRDADQIIVLNGGRIAERGSHAELAESGGEYSSMLAGTAPVRAEEWR